jgi:hypothetical protein
LQLSCSQKLLGAEPLDERETKSKCLARTSEVSGDEVMTVVEGVEAVLLDGEKVLVPLGSENFSRSFRDLRKAFELSIFGNLVNWDSSFEIAFASEAVFVGVVSAVALLGVIIAFVSGLTPEIGTWSLSLAKRMLVIALHDEYVVFN